MHTGRTRPGTQSEVPTQITELKRGKHHDLLDGPKMGTKVKRVHRSKASHGA
jgi:hypothetical protein